MRRFLLLAAILTLLTACPGRQAERPRVPTGTPIVLISIDTLRSDRLPAYGYGEVETPALDALRRDSLLYLRAYAPVPLTFPSHASLLTGLLPPDHGVRDNQGYRLDAGALPYLPRTLQRLGYATGAAVSSFVLRGNSGLAEGFDFFEDRIEFAGPTNELGSVQRPGGETLELALEWLRTVRDGPFFLFFHIYEPHAPFEPPEPFRSRYPSRYDGEVAASDQIVGDLLAALKREGLYERSIVLLTSDHGEGLGEHGYYEHGPFLYREALQVPLMLKLPGSERGGEAVGEPVQLLDVLPTLLELLGEEIPEGLPGASLLRPRGGAAAARRILGETFYPRLHFGWSDLISVIEYPYHYIHGPDPELYDLESDPGETENIVRRERRLFAELRREVEGYDRTLQLPTREDPEVMEKLAALGYVGSVVASGEGPLPDPKSRVGALAGMREAMLASADGRFEEAVERIGRVLEEEPGMVDAWVQLGHALFQLGRDEEALAAYEKALELTGGAPHLALPTANVLLRLNRLDDAKTYARIAASVHDLAYGILAQIAIREENLEEAERHVQKAVDGRGRRVGPLITQAKLRLKQGRLREAIEITEVAEREFGSRPDREQLRGLYFVRGDAYARLGEAEPAVEAFEAEIAISPGELSPYTHLAFLHALAGRGSEAGATLRRMVEANPTPHAYAQAVRTLREMGDERSASALLGQALRRWPQSSELRSLTG